MNDSTINLAGKTALVTGGGSGIGAAVGRRMARDGAHVVVLDLDADAAEATAGQIADAGGEATVLACDVADARAVNEAVSTIIARRPIDILVNSAGIAHIGNLENTTEADLDRLYAVNVKGTYNSMAAVIGGMKVRNSGVIVNIASVASTVGIADRFAYSMTKGAVITMTYSVAKDYIGNGIRCNCVSPARVHTPFVDRYLEENYPENRAEMFEVLSKTQPIGRMGTPDEVAGLVAFLCSDAAAFITGSNYAIDGGFVTLNS